VSSVVLCSGGIDSVTIAFDHAVRGETVELLFVDYGQPARSAERRSVRRIADHLAAPTISVVLSGIDVPAAGEIAGRNLLLISIALAARPGAGVMCIGIHSGTGYRDCSPAFVELIQQVLDFHTNGASRLAAPFADWSKADVVALARELDVPLELTHSCEAADKPCGRCCSCVDREVLLAG
jgi:7-cyano-7-deazaguanine synthase